MKNRVLLILSLASCVPGVNAQTQYEAARFSENELNGTARFVGMGGAMGALGADISVIGTNPAGIGLYRSHDVSTSFGFNATKTASEFGGTQMKDKNLRASFDQIGFVYSNKIGNRTTLRYVNFGFNYHKSKNFNRYFQSGGMLEGLSQTQQMANMVNGSIGSINEMDNIYNYDGKTGVNPYSPTASNYPYLGVMGIRTELVGVGTFEDSQGQYQAPIGWYGDASGYQSREEGGIHEYDFNISTNIEDRIYLGLTLGVYDINYHSSTYYTEDIYDGGHSGYYELRNDYRVDGSGLDLKFGAIFRPVLESPFRFGVAIHTPIWYNLTETYASEMYSNLVYEDGSTFEANEYTPDYTGGKTLRDYQLRTPWRFNLNLGTVFGGIMAVGAEYEYADYSSSKLRYADGYEMANQTSYIAEDLKGVHTIRLGMETCITPAFSLRAGYNYSTSAYKETAYKALDYNDMRADTEYRNSFGHHTATVGLGYRWNYFYADLAYKYDTNKSDFYAFSAEDLKATKVTDDRHQLLLTLGVKF